MTTYRYGRCRHKGCGNLAELLLCEFGFCPICCDAATCSSHGKNGKTAQTAPLPVMPLAPTAPRVILDDTNEITLPPLELSVPHVFLRPKEDN